MHNSVHATELLNVAAHNVLGDHVADLFDHAVSYTSGGVDGDKSISIVDAIVGQIVDLLHLGPIRRLDAAICRGIDEQKDSGKEIEGTSPPRGLASMLPVGKWCDENGIDTMESLVKVGEESTHLKGLRPGFALYSVIIILVGCKSDDRSIKGFKSELV